MIDADEAWHQKFNADEAWHQKFTFESAISLN
jgi:hypothetical protein